MSRFSDLLRAEPRPQAAILLSAPSAIPHAASWRVALCACSMTHTTSSTNNRYLQRTSPVGPTLLCLATVNWVTRELRWGSCEKVERSPSCGAPVERWRQEPKRRPCGVGARTLERRMGGPCCEISMRVATYSHSVGRAHQLRVRDCVKCPIYTGRGNIHVPILGAHFANGVCRF